MYEDERILISYVLADYRYQTVFNLVEIRSSKLTSTLSGSHNIFYYMFYYTTPEHLITPLKSACIYIPIIPSVSIVPLMVKP